MHVWSLPKEPGVDDLRWARGDYSREGLSLSPRSSAILVLNLQKHDRPHGHAHLVAGASQRGCDRFIKKFRHRCVAVWAEPEHVHVEPENLRMLSPQNQKIQKYHG